MTTLFPEISVFCHPNSVDFTDTCWPRQLSIHGLLKSHKEHGTRLVAINVSMTIIDALLNFVAWAAEHTTTKSDTAGTGVEVVRTLVGINEDGQSGVVARVMGIIACDELHDQSPGGGVRVIGQRRGVELKLKMHAVICKVTVRVKPYIWTAIIVIIRRFFVIFFSSCCKWTTISFLGYPMQVRHWNAQRLDC